MSNIIRLPGLIDIHVHLRDPGETQKEDFYSGTCAALAGGITTVFDMPNNIIPVFTTAALNDKLRYISAKAVCDYGLYFGTNGLNTDEFKKVADRVVGLKLYLSQSTGKYVVGDDESAGLVFKKWPKNKLIVIHAEDDKVDLAINLAEKYGNKIHITHINTKKALESVISAKLEKANITCDVTPHHLFLDQSDLSLLKGLGKVKPPLKTTDDKEYLWDHLDSVDCLCSDHAPHTVAEKKGDNPPAGVPGLETFLPLFLSAMHDGRINLQRIIQMTNTNPQKIFGYVQDKNTYIEVDMDSKYTINNEDLKTKCKWSPFTGWEVQGKVNTVYIRGQKVFDNEQILVRPGFGKQIRSI